MLRQRRGTLSTARPDVGPPLLPGVDSDALSAIETGQPDMKGLWRQDELSSYARNQYGLWTDPESIQCVNTCSNDLSVPFAVARSASTESPLLCIPYSILSGQNHSCPVLCSLIGLMYSSETP